MYHSRWKGTHYNAGFHYGNLTYKNGINLLKNIHINNERKLFSKKCIPLYKKFLKADIITVIITLLGIALFFLDHLSPNGIL